MYKSLANHMRTRRKHNWSERNLTRQASRRAASDERRAASDERAERSWAVRQCFIYDVLRPGSRQAAGQVVTETPVWRCVCRTLLSAGARPGAGATPRRSLHNFPRQSLNSMARPTNGSMQVLVTRSDRLFTLHLGSFMKLCIQHAHSSSPNHQQSQRSFPDKTQLVLAC